LLPRYINLDNSGTESVTGNGQIYFSGIVRRQRFADRWHLGARDGCWVPGNPVHRRRISGRSLGTNTLHSTAHVVVYEEGTKANGLMMVPEPPNAMAD